MRYKSLFVDDIYCLTCVDPIEIVPRVNICDLFAAFKRKKADQGVLGVIISVLALCDRLKIS